MNSQVEQDSDKAKNALGSKPSIIKGKRINKHDVFVFYRKCIPKFGKVAIYGDNLIFQVAIKAR